jgi:hypothetical protein
MAKVVRGLYRFPGWAYITDGIMTFDIREDDYRAKGYEPDYNKLPSKSDYDMVEAVRKAPGAKKGGSSAASRD